MTRRTGLLAAVGALLSGCSASAALNTLVARDTYRGREGVAYGDDPRQKLDVFLPLASATASGASGSGKPPLVVFFYGGSWTRGDRAGYRFVGEALAANGVAAIVADYRLSPQVRWQGLLADCAQATKWAFDHAAELGCDPARIYLMGHSAGGYNAAMLALDPRWLGAVGLSPQRLAGWIGLSGPYDFLPIGDPDTRVAFDWPNTPLDSQPVAHVSKSAPRTLLLAARNDSVVSAERSTIGLGTQLRAAGVPVSFSLVDKVNHVTVLASVARPLNWMSPVLANVLAFVRG